MRLVSNLSASLQFQLSSQFCTPLYLMSFAHRHPPWITADFNRSYVSAAPELNILYLYLHSVISSATEISPGGARREHIVQGEKQPFDFAAWS